MLTIRFRLVLRLTVRGAVYLLLVCAFMECAKATITLGFYFTLSITNFAFCCLKTHFSIVVLSTFRSTKRRLLLESFFTKYSHIRVFMCPTSYSVQKCYLGQQDHILGHFNPVEPFIHSLFKICLVPLSIVLSGTVLCKVCS